MATPELSPVEPAALHPANARRVVLAAYFGIMVSFGSLLVFSFGMFLKLLASEFAWSREAVSAVFGFGALTVAVCSPVIGQLLAHFGPRSVILPCMNQRRSATTETLSIPVIFLTAYSDTETLKRSRPVAVAYLTKTDSSRNSELRTR